MYIKLKHFLILVSISLINSISAFGQCAMCRAALESEEGGVKAAAVNDGIVYLMAIPYILVAILAYGVYRIRRKK